MRQLQSFATAVILVAILAGPLAARGEEPLAILRQVKAVGGTEPTVEIIADRALTYHADTMPSLLRGIIDLPLTDPGPVAAEIPVASGMISRITVQKKKIGDLPVTRLVIHLQQNAQMTVMADQGATGRLIVSFKKAPAPVAGEEQRAAPAPAPAPPTVPRPSPPLRQEPVVAPLPAAAGAPVVEGITVTRTGIAIDADRPVSDFHVLMLRDPARLVIDIPGGRSSLKSVPVPANSWGVLSARVGVYRDKLRLVFDRKETPLPVPTVKTVAKGLTVTFTRAGQEKQ